VWHSAANWPVQVYSMKPLYVVPVPSEKSDLHTKFAALVNVGADDESNFISFSGGSKDVAMATTCN